MKSRLASDSEMFSGQVNWTRQPPEARGVEANSYVGSGSMTATESPGLWRSRWYATLEPMTPPPRMATSKRLESGRCGGMVSGRGGQSLREGGAALNRVGEP